ncbi:RNA polymerase II transcription factor SIII, subunit A [Cynara cardunculus var. scolymus]|uniref:RNA polymerase II transcription factor SIII, subunit A n=1 Tax=Cynara cardunculus var. scolymus TaxID=59895 RepID=A0A103YA13_CYNCS|nr:RNA polymerase II transcription factor SIII, subunit A [Cynara cardunculus var. scolymus]
MMRSGHHTMEEWGTEQIRRVPSLVDLCVQKAVDNVRYLGDVGETDLHLLERFLPHCTVEQLTHIEDSTEERDLSPVTDKLWKNFYMLQFGSKSTNVVIERMKEKKVSFKWRQLYEAKVKDVDEAQQKSFERIKQLYKKEDAIQWRDSCGDDVSELNVLVVRILGLTCSTSTWTSLMYIIYNMKLKHKSLKGQSLKEENDSLIVEDVFSDDEWIANSNDEDNDMYQLKLARQLRIKAKVFMWIWKTKMIVIMNACGAMQFDHISRNSGLEAKSTSPGSSIGNTKSGLMKKAKLEFLNSREVKNLSAMKKTTVQYNQRVSPIKKPNHFPGKPSASSSKISSSTARRF